MSKPKIKKISREELPELREDSDVCTFMISYDEDMKMITLAVKAGRPMKPDEWVMAVGDFINDVQENPAILFVEDAYSSNEADPSLN
jgi:phosphomannomutase